jgi:hypothetical protein
MELDDTVVVAHPNSAAASASDAAATAIAAASTAAASTAAASTAAASASAVGGVGMADEPWEEAAASAAQLEMIREAVLMLQQSCGNAEAFTDAATLLLKYLSNIVASPHEPKFRTIKKSNARFHATLGRHAAARQLLRLVGFVDAGVSSPAELEGAEPAFCLPETAEVQPLAFVAHALRAVASPTVAQPAVGVVEPPQPPQPPQPQQQPPPPASSQPTQPPRRPPQPQQQPRTITEAQVAKLRAQKLTARSELSMARGLKVLRPGEGLAAAPPPIDVTDDFYELTEDDLRGISLVGGGAAKSSAAPTMQTAAMRELAKLQSIKEYSHALVRVRLPGGLLLEAAFHPLEPVGHVLDLVRSCLQPPLASLPAYLFTTPPRTRLRSDSSLTEAGLVPAATAVLAFDAPLPSDFASMGADELLEGGLLLAHAREALAAAAAAAPPTDEASAGGGSDASSFPTSASSKAAAAAMRRIGGGGGAGHAGGNSGGEGSGEAGLEEAGGGGGAAKKPKQPKWLKM